MRISSRFMLMGLSCLTGLVLIPQARAQEAERAMNCDENWQSDRASHCEINETTLATLPRLSVDSGVNGGMMVKGWQKKSKRASFQGEMACPDFLLTKKPARNGFAEVARIIHHVLLEHRRQVFDFSATSLPQCL